MFAATRSQVRTSLERLDAGPRPFGLVVFNLQLNATSTRTKIYTGASRSLPFTAGINRSPQTSNYGFKTPETDGYPTVRQAPPDGTRNQLHGPHSNTSESTRHSYLLRVGYYRTLHLTLERFGDSISVRHGETDEPLRLVRSRGKDPQISVL